MTRKILTFSFDFFVYFYCPNQTSITSVRNEIFSCCKQFIEANAV